MGMDDVVAVRDAGSKGRGVFALRAFARGDLILRFARGRTVHVDEVDALTPWDREHLGELTAGTCQVLPPPRCYLNHACAPNAISSAEAVHAWRPIRAGEEITIDYRLNCLDPWEMICTCDAQAGPHRVIGDFSSLPDDLQLLYLPYAPPYVQQAYHLRHGILAPDAQSPWGEPSWPTAW